MPLRRPLGGRRARRRRRRVGRVLQVAEYTAQREDPIILSPPECGMSGAHHHGVTQVELHLRSSHRSFAASKAAAGSSTCAPPPGQHHLGRGSGEQRRGQDPDGHEEEPPVLDGLLDAARRGTTTACDETVRTRSTGSPSSAGNRRSCANPAASCRRRRKPRRSMRAIGSRPAHAGAWRPSRGVPEMGTIVRRRVPTGPRPRSPCVSREMGSPGKGPITGAESRPRPVSLRKPA